MKHLASYLYGRVGWLLLMVILLNFGYPITESLGNPGKIIFRLAYALVFIVGIMVTSAERKQRLTISLLALVWFFGALIAALLPGSSLLLVVSQLAIIPAQLLMTLSLWRFIFKASVVNANVMMAAVTIYLLISAMFTPIYVIISRLDATAFWDAGLKIAPDWQQLTYFSFTTLATIGYGDITPINAWARSFATLEGVIGVLYIALIIGRLVGIYSQKKPGEIALGSKENQDF